MWMFILGFIGALVIVAVIHDAERDRSIAWAKWNLWPYDDEGNLLPEPPRPLFDGITTE